MTETNRSRQVDMDGWSTVRLRADNGDGEFVRFAFPRAGGGQGKAILRLEVTLDQRKLVGALLREGALLPTNGNDRTALVQSIITSIPSDEVGVLASNTGWHSDRFILGAGIIGRGGVPMELMPNVSRRNDPTGARAGSFRGWKRQVAKPARQSTAASFAIMAAFAGPLLRYANLPEGAVFSFVRRGASGKTTACLAASSVAGRPDLSDWNLTDRALFERAASCNDLPMILDDMERFRPDRGGRAESLSYRIHALTSGKSAEYSQVTRDRLPELHWRTIILTSSPRTLVEEFARTKVEPPTGGDESRWIDLVLKHNGGIWDRASVDDKTRLADLSDTLRKCARKHHGHAMPRWIRYLQSDVGGLEEQVRHHIDSFMRRAAPDEKEVRHRIAKKFAVVYAAGALAREAGMLPWSRSHAWRVVSQLLAGVLASASHRARALTDAKINFAAALSNPEAFPLFSKGVTPTVPNAAGLCGFRRDKDGSCRAYVTREKLAEVYGDFAAELLSALDAGGALVGGHGERSAQLIRIADPARASARFLVLNVDIAQGVLRPSAH